MVPTGLLHGFIGQIGETTYEDGVKSTTLHLQLQIGSPSAEVVLTAEQTPIIIRKPIIEVVEVQLTAAVCEELIAFLTLKAGQMRGRQADFREAFPANALVILDANCHDGIDAVEVDGDNYKRVFLTSLPKNIIGKWVIDGKEAPPRGSVFLIEIGRDGGRSYRNLNVTIQQLINGVKAYTSPKL